METRRTFLTRLAALGAAMPLASALAGVSQATMRPIGGAVRSSISARQLAGQRVIYSYAGLTVPNALLQAISAGEAAGVIFFGENIASDAQLAAVVQQLQQAQGADAAPLLLMTDQEGGIVRRLSGAPEQSAKQIGQAADPAAAASEAGA